MSSDQSEPSEEKEADGGSVVKEGGGERNRSSFRTEEEEEEVFTYIILICLCIYLFIYTCKHFADLDLDGSSPPGPDSQTDVCH